MTLGLRVKQLLVIAGVFLAWSLCDSLQVFNPDVIPPLSSVASAALEMFSRSELYPAIWLTLRDSVAGVAIAALLGIPLGLWIGMFPKVELSTRILLDFGRAFPVIALVPIFILIIGTNHSAKITMIAIACFFPILVQTIYGARHISATVTDTAISFRIPAALRFRKVTLPAALPYIATGMRLSLSISILVAIAAEILTSVPGMGTEVRLARTYNEVSVAFVYTLYAGLLGVALTAVWGFLEGKMLAWHHRDGEL